MHFRKALDLNPADLPTRCALAGVLSQIEPEAAVQELRSVLQVQPELEAARSNLLVSLHYREHDPQQLFQEHLEWDKRHARPLRSAIHAHQNVRDPERKLRLGYVSPDFREHSVAYFAASLLAGHNRSEFEIHVFDTNEEPDNFTRSLR
jgi:predicted O-linked N-acetylglucosamine transferase (SPINDLY family)